MSLTLKNELKINLKKPNFITNELVFDSFKNSFLSFVNITNGQFLCEFVLFAHLQSNLFVYK